MRMLIHNSKSANVPYTWNEYLLYLYYLCVYHNNRKQAAKYKWVIDNATGFETEETFDTFDISKEDFDRLILERPEYSTFGTYEETKAKRESSKVYHTYAIFPNGTDCSPYTI